ncbi:MAG TPA: LPS export ABC transporter periplasmic protein LptC [Gammaproteobacteria bacterium]|nr:LPS export ABC transporter periplasmic protein LptC [Gammaproteobacteria bacterium]
MKWGWTQSLLFAILLVVAITSFIWLDQPDSVSLGNAVNMADLKADYYLEGFETVRYGADGTPEYHLTGDTLLHYPANQTSEIIRPRLSLQRPLEPAWTVASASGWLQEQSESFRLEGDVEITRSPFEDQPEIQILTSEVLVHPAQRRLETDSAIEIRSRDWHVSSTGLKSNLADGKLSLLSNVRARYEIR